MITQRQLKLKLEELQEELERTKRAHEEERIKDKEKESLEDRLRGAMEELGILRKEREKMKELMDSFVQENDELKLLLKREREEYQKW